MTTETEKATQEQANAAGTMQKSRKPEKPEIRLAKMRESEMAKQMGLQFWPDFFRGNLDDFWLNSRPIDRLRRRVWKANLPTIEELQTLQMDDLRELRKHYRAAKRQMRKQLIMQKFCVSAFRNLKLEDIQIYIGLDEISRHPQRELEEIKAEIAATGRRDNHPATCGWQEIGSDDCRKHHGCNYGKPVAMWCLSAGCPGCGAPCILANGTEETLKQCIQFIKREWVDMGTRNRLLNEYLKRMSWALHETEDIAME